MAELFGDRAPWRVGYFTFAELRRLDAAKVHSGTIAGELIPTLREVIDALGTSAGLLLEVKDPHRYPGIEGDVYRELRAIPGYLGPALNAGRLVVQSFDHDSMRAVHALAPEVPVRLLFRWRPTLDQLAEAADCAVQVNTDHRVNGSCAGRVHPRARHDDQRLHGQLRGGHAPRHRHRRRRHHHQRPRCPPSVPTGPDPAPRR